MIKFKCIWLSVKKIVFLFFFNFVRNNLQEESNSCFAFSKSRPPLSGRILLKFCFHLCVLFTVHFLYYKVLLASFSFYLFILTQTFLFKHTHINLIIFSFSSFFSLFANFGFSFLRPFMFSLLVSMLSFVIFLSTFVVLPYSLPVSYFIGINLHSLFRFFSPFCFLCIVPYFFRLFPT